MQLKTTFKLYTEFGRIFYKTNTALFIMNKFTTWLIKFRMCNNDVIKCEII
jgi:hypothetical protein